MSLVASLNVGVSALRSFSEGIQVISNNISNVSTVAYKASHANYADAFSNLLKPLVPNETGLGAKVAATQIGGGVQVQSVTASFNQGTISTTGSTADLAIAGPGYFRVKDPISKKEFVTRAGNFRFDANGYLVTQEGFRVQGSYGAQTTVTYDPGKKVYDVKAAASNPVTVQATASSSSALGAPGVMTVDDASGLSVGMVVYSASYDRSTSNWTPGATGLNNHAVITAKSGNTITLSNLDGVIPNTPRSYTFIKPTQVQKGVSDFSAFSNTQSVSITNGSQNATLSSTAGVKVGMAVSGAGIPANTTITAISGNSITLSAAASATNTAASLNITYTGAALATARQYTVKVDDSSDLADGMVVGITDPVTNKVSYAGVSKVTGGSPMLVLDFDAFGSAASNPTPSNFQSTANGYSSGTMGVVTFETNYAGTWYTGAGNVGDVRISFESDAKNGSSDFSLVDINGGALGTSDKLAALSGAPRIRTFAVGNSGDITINLSNGQTFVSGKVLMQSFKDPGALVREGGNLFSQMEIAGAINGEFNNSNIAGLTAGTTGLGLIQGSALELSNVDIGEEFAQMITTQRSFQAGSRVISISDQMLEEVVNLKR
jgi:flagellar hook protein FlgE